MRAYNLMPDVKSISDRGGKPAKFLHEIGFDLKPMPRTSRTRRWRVLRKVLEPSLAETDVRGAGRRSARASCRYPQGVSADACLGGLDAASAPQPRVLDSAGGRVPARIGYSTRESLAHAISTLKQLFARIGGGFHVGNLSLLDYPSVEMRSMSTTFAWYAGYGRIGFDSQLWGFEEWKEFLDSSPTTRSTSSTCACTGTGRSMFPEYPETCLRGIPVKIWNTESGNYVDVLYTHPNLVREFLSGLVAYAHLLRIRIFAYVGLNSYNGGYLQHPQGQADEAAHREAGT